MGGLAEGFIGVGAQELVEVGREVRGLTPAVEGGAAEGEGLADLVEGVACGEKSGGLDLGGVEVLAGGSDCSMMELLSGRDVFGTGQSCALGGSIRKPLTRSCQCPRD